MADEVGALPESRPLPVENTGCMLVIYRLKWLENDTTDIYGGGIYVSQISDSMRVTSN